MLGFSSTTRFPVFWKEALVDQTKVIREPATGTPSANTRANIDASGIRLLNESEMNTVGGGDGVVCWGDTDP
jgi:hypothetical protein